MATLYIIKSYKQNALFSDDNDDADDDSEIFTLYCHSWNEPDKWRQIRIILVQQPEKRLFIVEYDARSYILKGVTNYVLTMCNDV